MLKSNPDNLKIRMAVSEDAGAIATVLLESFEEYRSLYTGDGFAATTPHREQILNRMNEGPMWVASRDETIVGTVSVVVRGEALYIRGMAVLPNARGQSAGVLLLRQVEAFASERSLRRLFLNTTPFLHRAIRLYQRFGFARTDERPHDLFGTPLFSMEKALAVTDDKY
jgi:putative acetyltransferase